MPRGGNVGHGLTDDQVEEEIAELLQNDAVRLAFKYDAYRYRRRQYLYALRQKVKQGMKLMEAGYTMENLKERFEASEMDGTMEGE